MKKGKTRKKMWKMFLGSTAVEKIVAKIICLLKFLKKIFSAYMHVEAFSISSKFWLRCFFLRFSFVCLNSFWKKKLTTSFENFVVGCLFLFKILWLILPLPHFVYCHTFDAITPLWLLLQSLSIIHCIGQSII